MQNKSINETVSHIDPNFKKKYGKSFKYISMKDKESEKYLNSDSYYTKNFKNYNEKFTGEIAIDINKNKLTGYIYVGDKGSKNFGFIQTLEVKKEYRGYGISNKLLDDAIKKYNAIDLLVDKTNKIAIALYKKHGFVIIKYNDKKQYYMKLKSKLSKEDIIVNESTQEKEKDSLLKYKRVDITPESIKKYKGLNNQLSHIKDNSFGYMYLHKLKLSFLLVAFIACEKKDNGEIWIQALVVNSLYRNKGLGKQLLNVACKQLKATHLSVNKKNTIAINMYKEYGFKIYDESESMYFMKLN